ncbi:hypothetical protein HMPREF9711_01243 [Myroides odoratimimus CCUG 3837]|nr:hypothetical protein HMPREF9711_01243 [Myroides odoratimimus CCUG 3837]
MKPSYLLHLSIYYIYSKKSRKWNKKLSIKVVINLNKYLFFFFYALNCIFLLIVHIENLV